MTITLERSKRDCICLRCDGEQFVVIPEATIDQFYCGVEFHVTSPGIICTNCGWLTVGVDQVDLLRTNLIRAYEAYKEDLKTF